MYGILSCIKKLEKLSVKYACTLRSVLYQNIENIKEGEPIREAYNQVITDTRDKFTSYYIPVLEKLSKSEEKLTKERKRLLYFNTLIMGTYSYFGFKYTMPINLILFLSSGIGLGVNLFLNYKLNELIYNKEEILETFKVTLSIMNKSDEIINKFIQDKEIENRESDMNNSFDYQPQEKSYPYEEVFFTDKEDKPKVRKRMKRDGDK